MNLQLLFESLKWGSAGDWVSGLATLAAVVVALVFSLRQEGKERESQLASVHTWLEITPSQQVPELGTLWLVNNTDNPIYEWDVRAIWQAGGREIVVETGQTEHGLLPPGRHAFTLHATSERPLPENDSGVRVDLRFKDASGRLRRRLPTGKLA